MILSLHFHVLKPKVRTIIHLIVQGCNFGLYTCTL